jgi:hypothetical protein
MRVLGAIQNLQIRTLTKERFIVNTLKSQDEWLKLEILSQT